MKYITPKFQRLGEGVKVVPRIGYKLIEADFGTNKKTFFFTSVNYCLLHQRMPPCDVAIDR